MQQLAEMTPTSVTISLHPDVFLTRYTHFEQEWNF